MDKSRMSSVERGIPVQRAISKSKGSPLTWIHHQRIGNAHFIHEVRLMPDQDPYRTRVIYSCYRKGPEGNVLLATSNTRPEWRDVCLTGMAECITDTSLVTPVELEQLQLRVPSFVEAVQRRYFTNPDQIGDIHE